MQVAILGCGYVGLELGRRLSPTHDVVGVRRSVAGLDAIEDAGFDGVQADLTEPDSLAAVPDADAVVFAASSGGRGAEAARSVYLEGQRGAIEHFASRDDPPERYLYTSSTGVYGDHDGEWVDEGTALDPVTEKTEVLAAAERVATEEATAAGLDGTVARLAGLYGPDRYRLERYVTGPVTAGLLNMVHRDDAAGAIAHLLQTDDARDEVVLVVDDEPVEKWTFADWLAAECGEPEPPKRTIEAALSDDAASAAARRRLRSQKRCSNERLRDLGYEFVYPTYREGYRAAIDAYRADQ